jgi:hypothetical protein
MQEIIENLTAVDRFNMNTVYDVVWSIFASDQKISDSVNVLQSRFSKKKYKQLAFGILRSAFLIELVKVPGIESTKFRTRWYSQLSGDPRECSFEECLGIAQNLLLTLTNSWLNESANCEALILFLENSILPYELPIDYIERPAIHDTVTRIHRIGNLDWSLDDNIVRTLKLRQYLTNPQTSPDAEFFKKVIDEKIKIKTYLTDRVLTGEHKTNREKRWEVNPRSVHFALRQVCMEIEYELITQLCAFQGFPEKFQAMLQKEKILPQNMEMSRCPITLEPLVFQEFKEELLNPTHGKSNFQVGHLNPLKLDEPSSLFAGHTAQNIAWISANGNRIQGSMSIEEVRSLLKKIAHNYENASLT